MIYRTYKMIAIVAMAGFWALIWAVNSISDGSQVGPASAVATIPASINTDLPVPDVQSWESTGDSFDLQPPQEQEVFSDPFDSESKDVIYTSAGGTPQKVSAEELAALTAAVSAGGSSGTSSVSSSTSAASGGSTGSSPGGGSSSGSDGTSSASNTPAQTGNAAVTGGGGTVDPFKNISVTILSSGQRLLQDDLPAIGRSAAQLYCAKNETEAFQIIVSNRSDSLLRDIEIHVSDWQGPAGTKRPELTLFREHYVRTTAPSWGVPADTPVGWYPQALIPFVDPYTGNPITTGLYRADHASVMYGQSQGYWADVRVDSDVMAGIYTCSLLITSKDDSITEIPVTLHVWDFVLPPVREWTAWFLTVTNLGKIYGLWENKGSSYDLLMSRHQDMLYEHGIYPTLQKYPNFDGEGNVKFYTYERALKTFVGKYGRGVLRIPFHIIEDSFDEQGNNPIGAKILSDYHNYSIAHPEYGQFFYFIDEPYTIEATNKVINIANLINTYAPSIKMFTNGDVYEDIYKDMYRGSIYHPGGNPDYTDYVNLAGAVEEASGIRSCYSRSQRPYTTPERLEAMMRATVNDGRLAWICQSSKLDQQLLMFRMASWRGYVVGATGQLEWRSMPADPALNPWLNPVNHGSASTHYWNGYDQYVYPGTPGKVGISGPGGPVASMGLKLYRSSVQDYAYFKLAESLTDRKTVVEIVSHVAPDFKTCYSQGAYETARRKIAEIILEHQ